MYEISWEWIFAAAMMKNDQQNRMVMNNTVPHVMELLDLREVHEERDYAD